MANVLNIQNKLIKEPEYIEAILSKLGYHHIKDRGRYIQFPHIDGDNLSANSILKENLIWSDFTRNANGNIFTLIMKDKNTNFPNALEWCSRVLGLDKEPEVRVKYPFHGFYKKLEKDLLFPESNIETWDIEELKPYLHRYNTRFIKDGIDILTQEYFNLGFSFEDNSILIPEYSLDGKLVGCKARNNTDNDYTNRWWMFHPFPKSMTLYGYHQNYRHIIEKKTLIIVESEKSVMQAHSFGCNVVLALGGHDISNVQAKYIKSFMAKKIILAFDEGISRFENEIQAEKVKANSALYTNRVGFIFDKENDILNMNSKDSPTDVGAEGFKRLLKEKIIYV